MIFPVISALAGFLIALASLALLWQQTIYTNVQTKSGLARSSRRILKKLILTICTFVLLGRLACAQSSIRDCDATLVHDVDIRRLAAHDKADYLSLITRQNYSAAKMDVSAGYDGYSGSF